jgi:hypothetical protein
VQQRVRERRLQRPGEPFEITSIGRAGAAAAAADSDAACCCAAAAGAIPAVTARAPDAASATTIRTVLCQGFTVNTRSSPPEMPLLRMADYGVTERQARAATACRTGTLTGKVIGSATGRVRGNRGRAAVVPPAWSSGSSACRRWSCSCAHSR